MHRATVLVALMVAGASHAGAQAGPVVQVAGPASNPITDAVATFTITTSNFAPADFPLRLRLQVATNQSFTEPLFADTTVDGASAVITIPRLLPEGTSLFWRAFALTARAGSVPSLIVGPRAAPEAHLRLLSPNNPAGQTVNTRRPRFVWASTRVPPVVGQWEYELRVEATASGRATIIATTFDTTFTAVQDLEANTSYRWRVTARLRSIDDSVSVASAGTFVVLSSDVPLTTVMFDPFPSPFPFSGVVRTCIWFDLNDPARVSLSVIDMRGLPVRTIFPAPSSGTATEELPRGRYGRPAPTATSGCDDRFSWDGTDVRNRMVPPGAYMLILRAGNQIFRRRVVFMGR